MKKVIVSRIVVLLAVGIVLAETRVAAVVTPAPLLAMPVTLAWNPANDPTVTGYALYYGPTNQPATNRVDAGPGTTATIYGLRANVGYRLYAVSYNAVGLESAPSNDLLLTPPAISRLQLARQSDGSMQLSGKAAPGTVCTIQFTPTLQPAAWQTLKHTTADQVGNVIALDTSGNKAPGRFYRVALGALPLLGGLQIQRQADGNMLLSGKAPPGASCRVQYAASPNATSWLTLKTVTAGADGTVTSLDTTARQVTRRFYRMAMP
jgi:hypothetical protein